MSDRRHACTGSPYEKRFGFARAVRSEPTLLLRDGEPLERAMRRARVRRGVEGGTAAVFAGFAGALAVEA